MEKRKLLNELFDLYGAMLTEKQKNNFFLYYQEDLSLGEIAEEDEISRNAVYDNLKRTEKLLFTMEEKLGFLEKKKTIKEELKLITKDITKLQKTNSSSDIERINSKINEISDNI